MDIPITLSSRPVPFGVQATGINELLTIVSQYMSGQINMSGISFFISGTVDPSSNQGLFFNTAANVFKYWSDTLGKYIPMSSLEVGDVKSSLIAGDDVANGWVVLDGRNIDLVTGITANQYNNLAALFGAHAVMPALIPLGVSANIPASSDFANIPISVLVPGSGTIGSQAFDPIYNPAQSVALAGNVELLRGSAAADNTSLTTLRDKVSTLVSGINTSSNSFAKMFVGYP